MSLKYFVYLVKSGNSYKIGFTKNVKSRIKSLQTGSSRKIELIDYFETNQPRFDESSLHEFLSDYRVYGEWFQIPSYVIKSRSEWFFSCESRSPIRVIPPYIPKEKKVTLVDILEDAYQNGNADIGVDLLLRGTQNKESAMRNLYVYIINQDTNELAVAHAVSSFSIHACRYMGLYGKDTGQLNVDCGANSGESPLHYMSLRDLYLNALCNYAAIEAGDVGRVGFAAQLFRNAFEQASGKPLTPEWTESCLPPSKARKMLSEGQLALPM